MKAYSTSAEGLDVIYLACNQNPGAVKSLSGGHHHGNGYRSANPQSAEQLVTKICAIILQVCDENFFLLPQLNNAGDQGGRCGESSPGSCAPGAVRCRSPASDALGSPGSVLGRLPLGVQRASVLGTRASARIRPSIHYPFFQRRCCRPANRLGAWGSRVAPTRPQ